MTGDSGCQDFGAESGNPVISLTMPARLGRLGVGCKKESEAAADRESYEFAIIVVAAVDRPRPVLPASCLTRRVPLTCGGAYTERHVSDLGDQRACRWAACRYDACADGAVGERERVRGRWLTR